MRTWEEMWRRFFSSSAKALSGIASSAALSAWETELDAGAPVELKLTVGAV